MWKPPWPKYMSNAFTRLVDALLLAELVMLGATETV